MATTTSKKKPSTKTKKTTKPKASSKKPAKTVKASAKSTKAKATTKASSASKKTTKKPVAPKKVASTKTDSKAITKKEDAKTKKAQASKFASMPYDKLRALHLSNFLIGVALAVLTVIFVKAPVLDFFLRHQARDSFATGDQFMLTGASDVVMSLNLGYIFAGLLGLWAIASFVLATRLFSKYSEQVKARASGLRWLVLGAVMALLVEFVTLLAGIQDVYTLKMVALVAFSGAVLAWYAEKDKAGMVESKNKDNGVSTSSTKVFFASLMSILAFLPALVSLIATSLIGAERFSWHVYVIFLIALLGVMVTMQVLNINVNKQSKYEYVRFEQFYVRILMFVLLAITTCMFVAYVD